MIIYVITSQFRLYSNIRNKHDKFITNQLLLSSWSNEVILFETRNKQGKNNNKVVFT